MKIKATDIFYDTLTDDKNKWSLSRMGNAVALFMSSWLLWYLAVFRPEHIEMVFAWYMSAWALTYGTSKLIDRMKPGQGTVQEPTLEPPQMVADETESHKKPIDDK